MNNLFEATLDLVWRQWRAIGAAAAGEPVTKQVDPEALCLASLFLRDHEPRLWIVMADWFRHGASLLSVQRLKNLVSQFPNMSDGVKELARVAWQEGKEARWKSFLGSSRSGAKEPRATTKQRSGGLALTAPPALLLRLRTAFTVGVRSDLLAFLLGQPLRVSVATAAASLGYSVPPVFRALQDLRASGFVRSAEFPSAAEYWVDAFQWYEVLGGKQALAPWGFWREILTYVCAALTLENDRKHQRSSEYARANALRELAMQHEADLMRAGVVEQGVPRSTSLASWNEFHDALAKRITAGASSSRA